MTPDTTVDRSGWGRGPWDDEPEDSHQWIDIPTGYICFAVRAPHTGSWCGYVCVPPRHAAFGLARNDAEQMFECHGGVTYAARADDDVGPRVDGANGDLWIIGFDCAHGYDATPAMNALFTRWLPRRYAPTTVAETYRTIGYVRDQCHDLATQLETFDRM